MNENLPVNVTGDLPEKGKTSEITVSGGNNSFVAHADTVKNNITVMLNDPRSRHGGNRSPIPLNTDFYHLFVMGDETYEDTYFLVPKDRALTEYTSDTLKEKYGSLALETIKELLQFPALFAAENRFDGIVNKTKDAYFGLVNDIKIQDNGTKVYFTILQTIPQQLLNERCFEFGIVGNGNSPFELYRTHWALKQIDLIEALQRVGVRIFW